MCGIIGYTGPLEAETILLDGLAQLEYRGYDSAGIAFFDADSQVQLVKCTGKVNHLKQVCSAMNTSSHCGIGHTRWATHGGVSDENAHPHRAGRVTLIHNGIIENYHQLTERWNTGRPLRRRSKNGHHLPVKPAGRLLRLLYHV